MGKSKNIGVNAVLNIIKNGLSIIFPLITYPYALRILGTENIGKVSYGSSIISYFLLFAMLGVSTYAVREGSKRKNDREAFSRFVNEVFTINVISMIISYSILFLAVLFVGKLQDYRKLILLLSLSIILTTLGVDWINIIFEDFLIITVRSIFSQMLSILLLFIFVHKPEDYYYYALLIVAQNGVICITNWYYCRKYTRVKLTRHPNFKQHLKPLLILFANALSITIYMNFDITMLGWIKGDHYVGLYSIAVRIYEIIKNLLASVYAVAIPRLAFYYNNDSKESYKQLYTDLCCYLILLLVPAVIGLICLAPEIMLLVGGDKFVLSSRALQILSVSLLFAIFGGLVTACLNVTLGREKENLKATIISALLNGGLNLYFIPWLAHYGAAVTTLISEAFVFIFCLVRIPDKSAYIDLIKIKIMLFHSVIGSCIIVLFSVGIKAVVASSVVRVAIIFAGSVLSYAAVLVLLKNRYILVNLNKIKNKVKGIL